MSARLLIALSLLGAGCLDQRGYRCSQSSACDLEPQGGVCQPDGYCSYPDPDCPSDLRYEEDAEGVGGECVPEASTTGSQTTGASTDGTDGDDAGPIFDEQLCRMYCDDYAATCADSGTYLDDCDCRSQCMQWPIGLMADRAGDSAWCRYNSLVEPGGIDETCSNVGPSSVACRDALAPDCDDYCALYFERCDPPGTHESCVAGCSHWYPGELGGPPRDSVGCRIDQLIAGQGGGDPQALCDAAGPSGGSVCVVPVC